MTHSSSSTQFSRTQHCPEPAQEVPGSVAVCNQGGQAGLDGPKEAGPRAGRVAKPEQKENKDKTYTTTLSKISQRLR